jgi:predicted MFS family arabinose efflux permease
MNIKSTAYTLSASAAPLVGPKSHRRVQTKRARLIRKRSPVAIDATVSAPEDLPRFLKAQPVAISLVSGTPEDKANRAVSITRLTATVILPFAFGYYLSYLFRSINAVVAGSLVNAFKLSPTELGVMTSVYFLACALVQLPAGTAIDRYGPRRVQTALMLVATLGAAIFSQANTWGMLVLGRTLVGIGVSVALMAGLKAIVEAVPTDRVALATGIIVMLGGLGAVTATLPADVYIQHYGWRSMFYGLALLSIVSAIIFYVVVPEPQLAQSRTTHHDTVRDIVGNPVFWRVAPLSTVTIATSWSLQTLWAAPWLQDVEGFSEVDMVKSLCVLAVALCAGSLVAGATAGRLRRSGLSYMHMLAAVAAFSIVAQLSLVLRCNVPALLPWVIIAASGGASVLSFMATIDQFPEQISSRVNAVLNMLQVGCAFFVQSIVGVVLQFWPNADGHAAVEAYQCAFGVAVGLQCLALGLFWLMQLGPKAPTYASHPMHRTTRTQDIAQRATLIDDRASEAKYGGGRRTRELTRYWRAIGLSLLSLTLMACTALFDAQTRSNLAEEEIADIHGPWMARPIEHGHRAGNKEQQNNSKAFAKNKIEHNRLRLFASIPHSNLQAYWRGAVAAPQARQQYGGSCAAAPMRDVGKGSALLVLKELDA